ncbi:hypothetical protein BGP77_11610 [Saccharospirillum sp. MSK14-1]|uniref:hypothetical protein n=1 Tax=Saccharospirillum sp. MSK14-1 TaxID=1897632 RepID=UPI000D39328A|nr:hypothetical protein [Saccharospirillum sp. MSK14-1]PTY38585.1 hypothetical protein BGP77_11610 [Saccharospirillum sp. MSK14-1]
MATPTLYQWMDESAPNPTRANANYNSAVNFLDILRACLVDGYGSKPGAGWTLENWDMTPEKERAAFGNGNGIIEVISTSTGSVTYVIHESVSQYGVGNAYHDGADPACHSIGVGSRTDYNADFTPDNTNQSLQTYVAYLTNASINQVDLTSTYGWRLVATDKTFIFWLLTNPDSSSLNLPNTYMHLYAGAVHNVHQPRDAVGNFVVMAQNYTNRNNYISGSGANSVNLVWLLALTNPFGDALQSTDQMAMSARNCSQSMFSPHNAYIPHTPCYLYYKGAANPDPSNFSYFFGKACGWRQCVQTTSYDAIHYYAYERLGIQNEGQPILNLDGYDVLCVNLQSNSTRGYFVSMNPADWV